MGFKCAPQVMGLVRGEPKNPRHRADGGKLLREMGEERYSRTRHLDRTLSEQNVYDGYASGQECWDYMCSVADEGTEYTTKAGEVKRRKLRTDAVIGWAAILHPPDEITASWSWEEFERFDHDAMEALAEIEPRVFRSENEAMRAEHRDEKGKHAHHAGIAKDEEGRFCGNLIDARLMVRINEAFPRLMRERGWEIEDMDVTDFDRAKVDEAYRAERDEKRRMGRLSVDEYAMRDAQRRAEEATAKMLEAEEAALEAEKAAREAAAQRAAALIAAQQSREGIAEMRADFEDEMSFRTRAYRQAKETQDERERELDRREQAIEHMVEKRTEEDRRKLSAQYQLLSRKAAELEQREAEVEKAEAVAEGGIPISAVVAATVEEIGKSMQPVESPYMPLPKERQPFFPQLREVWRRFTRWLNAEYTSASGDTLTPLGNIALAVKKRLRPQDYARGPIESELHDQRDYQHEDYQLG